MKLFNYLVGIILFFFACSASPTNVNGRFTVIQVDGLKFSVLLQINTNTGTNDLGGTTIVFSSTQLLLVSVVIRLKMLIIHFHNFCGGNYSPATVTRPMNNKIWVNIDLPFINSNNGTPVAVSPEWTDVVTIHFDVVDPNNSANLTGLQRVHSGEFMMQIIQPYGKLVYLKIFQLLLNPFQIYRKAMNFHKIIPILLILQQK